MEDHYYVIYIFITDSAFPFKSSRYSIYIFSTSYKHQNNLHYIQKKNELTNQRAETKINKLQFIEVKIIKLLKLLIYIKTNFSDSSIKMSKPKIDLGASKMSNINEIQLFVDQLKRQTTYQNASNNQLIHENKRILQILKSIQNKIDKELEVHKKNMLATNPHHKVVLNKDQMKILEENESSNAKLLTVFEKQLENILDRKKKYQQGLQDRMIEKQHQLEDKITAIKIELKKLHNQKKYSQKKLKSYQNLMDVDYLKQYARVDEQLRIYSAKYVKIASQYNKISQQLAIASEVDPEFQIPEQIYDKELSEREQQQYKQYQSIVKLCTILSKRNDSEVNKSNRIYTQKLKELQRTILHLTELQKSIAFKETQILEGKKNIQIIKMKLSNHQKIEKELFRMSNATRNSFGEQLRQKSYSSVKLGFPNQRENRNKLRNRGFSFAKLPSAIKP